MRREPPRVLQYMAAFVLGLGVVFCIHYMTIFPGIDGTHMILVTQHPSLVSRDDAQVRVKLVQVWQRGHNNYLFKNKIDSSY